MKKGYIFDIQGYSVHDGPGCRTLIFLKGCNLNCRWCSNPEGIDNFPVPLFNSDKCIADLLCVKTCSREAIKINDGLPAFSRYICGRCDDFKCISACQTGALSIAGYLTDTEQVMRRIQKDRQYWGKDGGVTLTGGEPLLQAEFAVELLRVCYESYIHTCLETCGDVEWKHLQAASIYSDWIFFDIKHTDTSIHNKWTGRDNVRIKENFLKLAESYKGKIVVRMPVIPDFNDSRENIEATADLIKGANLKEINILPVHHLGSNKYKLMGKSYYDESHVLISNDRLIEIKTIFEENGLTCYQGHLTPF